MKLKYFIYFQGEFVLWGFMGSLGGLSQKGNLENKKMCPCFLQKKTDKIHTILWIGKKRFYLKMCFFLCSKNCLYRNIKRSNNLLTQAEMGLLLCLKKKCWLWRAGDLKESMCFSSEQSSSTLGISFQLEHCFCSWISSFITASSSFQRWSPNGVDV